MYIHNLAEIDKGSGLVELIGPCSGPKDHAYSVVVSRSQLERYKAGELAQRAFPDLPKEQREFLISGTCPECWKDLFGVDEEDD